MSRATGRICFPGMVFRGVLVVVATLSVVGTADAQRLPPVLRGARATAVVPTGGCERAMRATDTIIMREADHVVRATETIGARARSRICAPSQEWRSDLSSHDHAGRGALIGAAAGALAGGAMAFATWEPCHLAGWFGCMFSDRGFRTAAGGAIGVFAGAVVGAVIGTAIRTKPAAEARFAVMLAGMGVSLVH